MLAECSYIELARKWMVGDGNIPLIIESRSLQCKSTQRIPGRQDHRLQITWFKGKVTEEVQVE